MDFKKIFNEKCVYWKSAKTKILLNLLTILLQKIII